MKGIFLISSPEIALKAATRRDVLLILLIVLAVFSPAVSGQVNSVDDVHILAAYEGGNRTIIDILSPQDKFYYRPFIELSYMADDLLWDLDPRMMHLENVFLHLCNAFLVYLVARRLYGDTSLPVVPFVASLLFAIHPVQAEAVSWIAGRTDPMVAGFVLLSLLFFLRARQGGSMLDTAFAAVMAMCAILTKETAAALLPSLLLLHNLPLNDGHMIKKSKHRYGHAAITVMIVAGMTAGAFLLVSRGTSGALGTFFSHEFNWGSLPFNVLASIGFYFRKFFFPYPLNFAIDYVSFWYAPVGILAILLIIYAGMKKNASGWAIVSAFLFLLPPVAAGIAGINWTPVAERYLYLPTAFMAIACSFAISRVVSRFCHSHGKVQALLLLASLPLAFITFDRNIVWRSNESLYRDAVNKSPEFGDIHLELGVALSQQGRVSEAVHHFELAEKLSKRPQISEFARTNLLYCSLHQKRSDEKRAIIDFYAEGKEDIHPDVIRMWRNIDQDILSHEKDPRKRADLMKEIISLNTRLFKQTRDAICLYTNGQLYLALGEKEKALSVFREAVSKAPADSYYFNPARKIVAELERTQ